MKHSDNMIPGKLELTKIAR